MIKTNLLPTLYAHAHISDFAEQPACHSGGNLKVIRLRVPLSATAKGNRTPTPRSGLTIPVGSLISLSECFPRVKHAAEHEPEQQEFGSVDWEDERAAKKKQWRECEDDGGSQILIDVGPVKHAGGGRSQRKKEGEYTQNMRRK